VVTSWVPGIILVAFQAELGAIKAIQFFFIGYILFVSVYEIGYLANDSYGLRNDSTPRRRVDICFNFAFVSTFISARIISFLGIAAWAGVITEPLFWFSYIVLSTVLLMHNTLRRVELKFFCFLQLSLLRFSLPVFVSLLVFNRPAEVFMTLMTGLMIFTYPRVITYMDAKGRLRIPERKKVTFLLLSLLTILPIISLTSAIAHTWAPISVWFWMLFVQIMYVTVNRFGFFGCVKRHFATNNE
jgi:hypothetical protein